MQHTLGMKAHLLHDVICTEILVEVMTVALAIHPKNRLATLTTKGNKNHQTR